MKIFIIYDDKNNKIGYFQLFTIATGRWKLEFMFLKEDKQKFEVFEQALVLLSNSVKRVEVCIMDDKPKKLFFLYLWNRQKNSPEHAFRAMEKRQSRQSLPRSSLPADLFGIGASIRTPDAARFKAISSVKDVILLILTPGAG